MAGNLFLLNQLFEIEHAGPRFVCVKTETKEVLLNFVLKTSMLPPQIDLRQKRLAAKENDPNMNVSELEPGKKTPDNMGPCLSES